MEGNRPEFQEPIVISPFEPYNAWYVKDYHAERWSIGYDLREWLVGITAGNGFFQINLLCFWFQFDFKWDG